MIRFTALPSFVAVSMSEWWFFRSLTLAAT